MADEIRTCADLDERLTPYVDGEDTPAAHEAVGVHLTRCPTCTTAARDEAAGRHLVRERRTELTAQAPAALRARCQLSASVFRSPRLRRGFGAQALLRKWAPLSVAATLVLAVAGVFAFGLNDRVQALAASLALDHMKCFKVSGTAAQADAHLSERTWQQDQGWPIAVPATAPDEQLKLVDVRRCYSTDGKTAHMMYTWRGEPLSVYVIQGDRERDHVVRKAGAQAVIWCANRRTYAVVSSDTTRDLTPIVEYMKARVR